MSQSVEETLRSENFMEPENKEYFKKYQVGKCQVQGGLFYEMLIKYSLCAKKTIKNEIEF